MKKTGLAVAAVVLMLSGCQHAEHHYDENNRFAATMVVQQDTVIYRDYVCQIRSSQHIELRALEKGYIQHIYVDEGQSVKKGQLMFQILPVVYQADMQRARAEVTFAEVEYQNTKALADSNVVSKNELALARARLEKAQAELKLAQAHLQFTEIRAPFDGIMDRLHVRTGSLVDEGELLTSLSDNNRMWVYFNVPESEYLNYITNRDQKKQTRVKLMMANRQLFEKEGVIETIEADFNNETGTIAFRAAFDNPKGILRHGETGNILMPVPYQHVLLIPQMATFEVLDKKFVYVITQEGTLQSREIHVVAELPHIYVVSYGLREGERILIEGLRKVKNGQHIQYTFKSLDEVVRELDHLHAE
ncbi:MAG: efflux RND transporter periplasmic adaptor subunit [Cyclobacteriaceae bacterium]|nr:efflux RND transporter periplasmic adaptor subunit [Cyclobacteriaceae bacterium]